MNDMIYFVISYAFVILIGFFLINFLSNGFLGTFLKVKASRGKKVLVEVHAVTDVYYTPGKFDNFLLKYKTREKKDKSLIVNKDHVFKKIGVFCVITDEVLNNIIDLKFNAGSSGSPEDYDHIIKRVMMAPQIDDTQKKIMIGLLILNLVGLIFVGFIVFQMSGQVSEIILASRVV